MKFRTRATVLHLTLALSSLFGAERIALAQSGDAVTEVARQRFGEGVKAFDVGRFEDARAAFLQAYLLKRNPMILLNLGEAEIKSNHPEDGGNHLQQFMHEATATPDQKATAEKGIADAKKRAAFIVVLVDESDAEVSLDGALVGKSPLLDLLFVKAGTHTLLASYGGKTATSVVDAKVGSATAANLTFGLGGAAIAGAGAPAPASQEPSPATPESGAEAGDSAAGDRESFFHWYTRKPLAWVGTGVMAVGLGLGIGFAAAAGSASATAQQHTDSIDAFSRADSRTSFGAKPPCGPQDGSGSDLPAYAQACAAVRKDLSAQSTDTAVAVTGWVFFGLGAAGTLVYSMVDRSAKKAPAARTTPTIQTVPMISSTARGFALSGTF